MRCPPCSSWLGSRTRAQAQKEKDATAAEAEAVPGEMAEVTERACAYNYYDIIQGSRCGSSRFKVCSMVF